MMKSTNLCPTKTYLYDCLWLNDEQARNNNFLFQLVSSLLSQVIMYKWPRWVDFCTFISHFLLATGASVNILLYCSCDRRFFVVVQKTLKTWFVWPITTKG